MTTSTSPMGRPAYPASASNVWTRPRSSLTTIIISNLAWIITRFRWCHDDGHQSPTSRWIAIRLINWQGIALLRSTSIWRTFSILTIRHRAHLLDVFVIILRWLKGMFLKKYLCLYSHLIIEHVWGGTVHIILFASSHMCKVNNIMLVDKKRREKFRNLYVLALFRAIKLLGSV